MGKIIHIKKELPKDHPFNKLLDILEETKKKVLREHAEIAKELKKGRGKSKRI